ncbi:UDP-N-acetylmuramate--L-alanine ligase [Alkalibaculum sp. M08DMB]|uniref:UDP-N-acetylmuramate--L-alanine ligase n=1 Tax=Alkalibaculum sporogenes TaxID=2655001 RepID=A0A6A7K669_9FIRM|nr:UDP-N-acetylmuramate--L-alanine ligase [Alkalibaculum sporogenes]MPW24979.1 UDP-N-acetylmuramate--L-alanine ligase [Alkalibaculum sporogenes]
MKLYLEKMLNKKINLVHFIGIGGVSMSGIALILMNKGVAIAGSDMETSSYTQKLVEKGAKVYIGHNEMNITQNCDLVIYTAAINKNNPEMLKAKELNIPLMERSDFLGALTKDFEQTIAVSGVHGKTTTSSIITSLLYNGNLDPTVTIGGSLDLIGGNYRIGNSEYFVTEACEYVDSFLKSHHKIGVILNIELDHTDYFKNLDQMKESFHNFAKILPSDGLLIAYGDSKVVRDIIKDLKCTVATFGFKNENQWQALNIIYDNLGKPEFDVYNSGSFFGHLKLNIPGEHNILNTLASIICANHLGVSNHIIDETLTSFVGAHRRFEFRGEVNDIIVFEDFAHHPTELKVTIQACTNYKYNKLWIVFQPHTYSRTSSFFDEFVNSFKGVDFVIINDVYSAREINSYNVHVEDLVKAVHDRLGIPSIYISDFKDIVKYLIDNTVKGDFVLVAGAGNINKVAFDFVDALKEKFNDNDSWDKFIALNK